MLVSGNGSNLQAVLDACADGRIAGRGRRRRLEPADVFALQRADAAGVAGRPHRAGTGRGPRAEYDARLADVVAGFEPDLVVLAGWMRVLTMSFLGWFPRQVINLHPALPGDLPGTRLDRRAWDAALAGARTSTGVMVHLVPDDGVDDGPTLATRVVEIDTRGSFEAFEATMHGVEHDLLVATVAAICEDRSILRTISRADRPHPPDGNRGAPRMSTRTNVNDDFFDRFEALTFDDVVVVPGYSETLPDAVDTSAHVRRRHRTRRAARVRRDGQGHRGRGWPSPWPATAASA